VSHLVVGDNVHVSDLPVAEGVEVLLDADQVVCAVVLPKAAAAAAEDVEGGAEGASADEGTQE
jgi:large subunit ribosomal protein L25